MDEPARISIIPSTQKIRYDFSKTLDQIQNKKSNKNKKEIAGLHGKTITQGLMEGSIQLHHNVKLGGMTYPTLGMACIWYDEITVELEIDPTIIIAKEVHEHPCMGPAVMQHERKHIRVDRRVVNKYAELMGYNIQERLRQTGFKRGPFKASEQKKIAQEMIETVFKIAKDEYQKMQEERMKNQMAVDTIQEYERVSAECPNASRDFIKSDEKWY